MDGERPQSENSCTSKTDAELIGFLEYLGRHWRDIDEHEADACIEAARRLEDQRWIPVAERLPVEYEDVDVWAIIQGSNGPIPRRIAKAHYWRSIEGHVFWWGSRESIDNGRVTHWRPLPAPPEDEVR